MQLRDDASDFIGKPIALFSGMRSRAHALTCVAVVIATTSVAHADETPPNKSKTPPYEWLAPLFLAGTSAGAMTLANAEGMEWGRVALDSSLAAVGFGVGLGLGYWLATSKNQGLDKILWGIAVITAGSTLAGIGLGEAILGREAFPKGTTWPATGGLAVGVVVDLGAIGAVMSAKRENQALLVITMVLLPIVIGTTSVAGFALALPK